MKIVDYWRELQSIGIKSTRVAQIQVNSNVVKSQGNKFINMRLHQDGTLTIRKTNRFRQRPVFYQDTLTSEQQVLLLLKWK